jgi:hypothetical protein
MALTKRPRPGLAELLEAAAGSIDAAAEQVNLSLIAARKENPHEWGAQSAIENVIRDLKPLGRRLRAVKENLPGKYPSDA